MLVMGTALAGTALAASGDDDAVSETIDVRSTPAGKAPRPNLNVRVPHFDLNTQVFTFPSGLRVMFQRDPAQPIVAITSVTDHGASNDPLGKEGIAHLVEHLWFRSEQGSLPKTWDLLEAEMGCNLNAFTQYDITAYMTVCASHNLEAMMKLESLRITDTVEKVTEEMVTTEVEVVRNEIRMRAENFNIPFFTFWEYVNGHLYAEEHPYHRPMAGDHTTIRNCKLKDIQQFTEDYYRPDTTTMMVVGDLPSDSEAYLLNLMVSTFDLSLLHPDLTDEHIRLFPREGISNPDQNNPDDWYMLPMDPANPDQPINYQTQIPVRAEEFANIIPPEPVTNELGVYEAPVEEETVVVAWTMPPGYQGDELVIDFTGRLLNVVMNVGNEAIKDVGGDFAGCGAIPSKRSTLALCISTINRKRYKNARPDQIAQKMIDQVQTMYMATDGEMDQLTSYRQLWDFWFSRIKQEFVADVLRSLDLYSAVGSGRATDIAQHAHFTGSTSYHSAKMIEAMQLEGYRVSELAAQWLKRDRATMVHLKPMDRDEVALLSEDTAGSGGHARGGGEGAVLNPSMDPALITPELIQSLISPPDQAKIADFKLPNGLRVITMPHGDAPIVRATLFTRGGSVHDTNGMLSLTRTTIDGDFESGRVGLDPLQFAGQWGGSAGDEYATMSIKGASGNLDGIMWMIRERVETSRPNMAYKIPFIKRRKNSIKYQWRKSRGWHVSDMRWEHLNAGHPLHDDLEWEDIDGLKNASSSDLLESFQTQWQPENATLLVVGRLDPREARAHALKYFGGWRAAANIEKPNFPEIPGPNASEGQRIYVYDDEGKTQTKVTLVCPLKPANSSYSPAHELLGNVARMTLFAKLREEAGVVYSPYAGVFTNPGGTAYMYMTAAIQNDSAVYGMEQYIDYLKSATEGKINADDVRLKQLSIASGFVLGQQSVDQMTGRMMGPIRFGESWDVWDEYAKSLANVTVEDFAGITKGCTEHAFISLEGPKDKVSDQLTEAGYEFEVVDWEQRGRDLYAAADPKSFKRDEKKRAKEDEDEDED
jgi:zinc protease